MRFVHPDQAAREIVSEENKRFTRENLHIWGREPTYEELLANYRQYNIICRLTLFQVIGQQTQPHGGF